IAFLVSCFFPTRYVYAFGVVALSTFILMLPFVTGALAEVFEKSKHRFVRRAASRLSEALMGYGGLIIASGAIVWFLLLGASRAVLGSLSGHLYVIPAAASVAAIAATGLTIIAGSIPSV